MVNDSIRFEVASVPPDSGDGFQVLVHVNDVEMTSAGAGLGMDPYDVFVPVNRLAATTEPRTVPIARCTCGVYGCGSTDVTVVRDAEVVRWDWQLETPMDRPAVFRSSDYDAEVERLGADLDWETPERTAGRLVLADADRDLLSAYGLRLSWVANDHRNESLFRVALQLDDDYQVFVGFPWQNTTPQELARRVRKTLALPPDTWPATWHPIGRGMTQPPAIAGPAWQREPL